MPAKLSRRAVYAALALSVALLLLLGMLLTRSPAPERAPAPEVSAPRLVPFNLVDHTGKSVRTDDWRGHPVVVFFGFTYCPDICPTTLAALTAHLPKLGAAADGLRIFFVTVDPARDTQAALAAYMSAFDPRIRALTGSEAELAKLARALGVYFARIDQPGGGYTMDHTASVLLFGRDGNLTSTLSPGEDPAVALEKLKLLAGS